MPPRGRLRTARGPTRGPARRRCRRTGEDPGLVVVAAEADPIATSVENGAVGTTGVSIGHLTLTLDEDGDRDLWMTSGPTTTGTPLPSTEGDAIAYLSVPEDEVGTATLRFSVTEAALAERGADADDVRLFQRRNGTWTAVDVRSVHESVAHRPSRRPLTGSGLSPSRPSPRTSQRRMARTPTMDRPTERPGSGTDGGGDDSSSDSAGSPSGSGGQPGFGVTAALLAVLGLVGILRKRRRISGR